ncbi:MAG: hypothetical protein SFV15_04280 [Polyangiaceae bacterium]|nr:hypothetical protein [Polyangiaceae bacterium]
MDCEQFDRVALDVLYDEVEEQTRSLALQHLSHCSRCNGVYARLKSAQTTGQLIQLSPPPELGQQILLQEHTARRGQGFAERMGRWMSIAAGYAMRPQVSMGALFLLMIGASLLFLRARPGDRDSVYVTEKGIPESEIASPAQTQKPHTGAPALVDDQQRAHGVSSPSDPRDGTKQAAGAPGGIVGEATDQSFVLAERAFRDHHFLEATELFDRVAAEGGPRASEAALLAAQSDLKGRGCAAAVERFERVYAQDPGGRNGSIAGWEAGTCYSQAGDLDRARRYFEALAKDPIYAERASRSLAALSGAAPTANAPAEVNATDEPAPKGH